MNNFFSSTSRSQFGPNFKFWSRQLLISTETFLILHGVVLYCIVLHCIVWYLISSYGIQFHCTFLRCWLRRAGCISQDACILHTNLHNILICKSNVRKSSALNLRPGPTFLTSWKLSPFPIRVANILIRNSNILIRVGNILITVGNIPIRVANILTRMGIIQFRVGNISTRVANTLIRVANNVEGFHKPKLVATLILRYFLPRQSLPGHILSRDNIWHVLRRFVAEPSLCGNLFEFEVSYKVEWSIVCEWRGGFLPPVVNCCSFAASDHLPHNLQKFQPQKRQKREKRKSFRSPGPQPAEVSTTKRTKKIKRDQLLPQYNAHCALSSFNLLQCIAM